MNVNSVINVIINCEFAHSFTFVHFVEEQVISKVPYRYIKEFESQYTDDDGVAENRTYSMCVRAYSYDVTELVDPYEEEWVSSGAQRNLYINGIK